MDLKTIGERVEALRTARGWSQKELGHRAKCSQQHVSFVENGKTGATWEMLDAILGALGQRLWVRVLDLNEELLDVQVSKSTADILDSFESLPAPDREVVLRFAKAQPAPAVLVKVQSQLIMTLEDEAAKLAVQAERRALRAKRRG